MPFLLNARSRLAVRPTVPGDRGQSDEESGASSRAGGGQGCRPARAGDLAGGAGVEHLAAAFADAAVADVAAALLVDDHFGRALGSGRVAVAPAEQGDQGGPEIEALLGQEVLIALWALLIGPAFEDALGDQPLQ